VQNVGDVEERLGLFNHFLRVDRGQQVVDPLVGFVPLPEHHSHGDQEEDEAYHTGHAEDVVEEEGPRNTFINYPLDALETGVVDYPAGVFVNVAGEDIGEGRLLLHEDIVGDVEHLDLMVGNILGGDVV
jgi:hypothetical protein